LRHAYIQTNIKSYTLEIIHESMYAHRHITPIYVNMYMYVKIQIYIHAYIYIHTYIHTHIHTHIHTCILNTCICRNGRIQIATGWKMRKAKNV